MVSFHDQTCCRMQLLMCTFIYIATLGVQQGTVYRCRLMINDRGPETTCAPVQPLHRKIRAVLSAQTQPVDRTLRA